MHRFTKPATNYRSVGSNPSDSVEDLWIKKKWITRLDPETFSRI